MTGVQTCALPIYSSNNSYLTSDKCFIVTTPCSQPNAWCIDDDCGKNYGWVYEYEMCVVEVTLEGLTKELFIAKSQVNAIQTKIDYLTESGADTFDENEYKVYTTLKTLENKDLSLKDKTKLIAELIKN